MGLSPQCALFPTPLVTLSHSTVIVSLPVYPSDVTEIPRWPEESSGPEACLCLVTIGWIVLIVTVYTDLPYFVTYLHIALLLPLFPTTHSQLKTSLDKYGFFSFPLFTWNVFPKLLLLGQRLYLSVWLLIGIAR